MTEPPRPPEDDPTRASHPFQAGDPISGSTPPGPPPYQPPTPPGPPTYQAPPAPGPPPYQPPQGFPPPAANPPPYGSPPPAAAPPPFGQFGAGPGYPQQPGYADADQDRTWLMVAHFGGAVLGFISGGWLGWIAPLISYIARGNQSPSIKPQTANALNFQLLWAIVALGITVVSSCLSVILIGIFGFFLLLVPWLMTSIFGIIAGVKALNNEPYRYPTAPDWIK